MKAITILLLLLGLTAIGCGGGSRHRESTEAQKPVPAQHRFSPALLDNLATLATGAPLPEAEANERALLLQRGTLSLPDHVDYLLSRPSFADDVGPGIALHNWALFDMLNIENQTFIGYVLAKQSSDKEGDVYYLREPCKPSEAEAVVPWWDPEESILVCPDSHRPDAFVDSKSGWHCDGRSMADALDAQPFCGCGPNLMRCYPGREELREFANGLVAEVVDTAAYLISRGEPVSALYTSNSTVRGRYAELAYRRWRVEAGESAEILADISQWPIEGKLAARYESHEGQHAGVLSTELVAFVETGMRPTLKNMFEKLWCSEAGGAHVSTEAMLDLADQVGDVRAGAGWQELAAKPMCENCHARLDYGMQFFSGFPDVRTAGHYQPNARSRGTGPLYNHDATDLRGEVALTPLAFAELATQQPEFGACVAQRVADHVLGYRQSPGDLDALESAFEQRATLQNVMKTALLRYAEREQSALAEAERPAVLGAPGQAHGDKIVLGAGLKQLIEEHCEGCHGEGSDLDLVTAPLTRKEVQRMLSNIASERMPRGSSLSHELRLELSAELIALLWDSPTSRDAAYRAVSGQFRGLSVHHVPRALDDIRRRAGGKGAATWPLIEKWLTGDLVQLTPGLATLGALEALKVCKERKLSDVELDACLAQAIDPLPLFNESMSSPPGATPIQ